MNFYCVAEVNIFDVDGLGPFYPPELVANGESLNLKALKFMRSVVVGFGDVDFSVQDGAFDFEGFRSSVVGEGKLYFRIFSYPAVFAFYIVQNQIFKFRVRRIVQKFQFAPYLHSFSEVFLPFDSNTIMSGHLPLVLMFLFGFLVSQKRPRWLEHVIFLDCLGSTEQIWPVFSFAVLPELYGDDFLFLNGFVEVRPPPRVVIIVIVIVSNPI